MVSTVTNVAKNKNTPDSIIEILENNEDEDEDVRNAAKESRESV
jgi:hypothetical protein